MPASAWPTQLSGGQQQRVAIVLSLALFLDGGRIIEEGPPGQLLEHPQQERTQQFLRRITDARRL